MLLKLTARSSILGDIEYRNLLDMKNNANSH